MKSLRKPNDSCPRSDYAQAARSIAVVMFIGGLILCAPIPASGDCDDPIPTQTPLNELWDHLYQPPWASPSPYPGTPGKLYRNSNQRPTGHNNEGIDRGDHHITPIDGKIFMISIGLSNTNMEFAGSPDSFIPRAMNDDKSLNSPPLVLVNGAQSGIDAEEWATHIDETEPNSPWKILRDRLTSKGMSTTDQVQVAWIKLALEEPELHYPPFPGHAEALRDNLITILQTLYTKYSNCQIAYLSTRTRAYSLVGTGVPHSPEPFAYETGFAVKWVIEKQIDDHLHDPDGGDLNYDELLGDGAKAPWICWGPYFWTDGLNPRSDGLRWLCNEDVSQSDVKPTNSQGLPDFVHPTANGIRKVTDQLLAFFKTDRTTKAWFRKVSNSPPTITISISPNDPTICAGDQVEFTASGPANIQDYNWNFDDGDCVIGPQVTKFFYVPGTYTVRLTGVLNDVDGNWATQTKQITVAAPPCPP